MISSEGGELVKRLLTDNLGLLPSETLGLQKLSDQQICFTAIICNRSSNSPLLAGAPARRCQYE